MATKPHIVELAGLRRSGRILIVDDDDGMRLMLAVTLEGVGHEIVGEAADGAAAVRLAEALRPDLITMDVDMPVLDGLSATRRIVGSGIAPVIIVSGSEADDTAAAAVAAGAQEYVSKIELASALPPAVEAVLHCERRSEASR
jgi:CheY-like chemotaxis protein